MYFMILSFIKTGRVIIKKILGDYEDSGGDYEDSDAGVIVIIVCGKQK